MYVGRKLQPNDTCKGLKDQVNKVQLFFFVTPLKCDQTLLARSDYKHEKYRRYNKDAGNISLNVCTHMVIENVSELARPPCKKVSGHGLHVK